MRSVAVYQSGMAHHRGSSLLHLLVMEFVREFFRKCWLSLAKADVALKEGRTLQLLQERLVGSNGIKDLQIDQSRKEGEMGLVRVYLVASRPLSDGEKAFVHATVDEVNSRYGSHIYAFIWGAGRSQSRGAKGEESAAG